MTNSSFSGINGYIFVMKEIKKSQKLIKIAKRIDKHPLF